MNATVPTSHEWKDEQQNRQKQEKTKGNIRTALLKNMSQQQQTAAHLVAAFSIYGYMIWVALSLLYPVANPVRHPAYRRTFWLSLLIAITIVSGGFVAGLKAGKIYNTFPTMGGDWIPPGLLALEPGWRNLTENMATVQFDIRLDSPVLVASAASRFAAARPESQ